MDRELNQGSHSETLTQAQRPDGKASRKIVGTQGMGPGEPGLYSVKT